MSAAIRTYSGHLFDVLNPRPEDVHIEDIAHHLSQLARYTGATARPYSVAQHSCYVSELVDPSLALCGLLHDATEAYINDLNRPVKHSGQLGAFIAIENELWRLAIAPRFNLPTTMPPAIKDVDRWIGVVERNCLNPNWPKQTGLSSMQEAVRIEAWPAEEAESTFLKRFRELQGK